MQSTEDERFLAALVHASIVTNAFNLAGMIAATLIWSTERERSPYVRTHAFQALIYQGIVLLGTLLLLLLWVVCVGLSFLPALLRPDLYRNSGPPTLFWLALLGLLVPLVFFGVATIYALYAAYQAYRGRPFRYPLVSRLTGRDNTHPAASTVQPSVVEAPPPVEEHPPADVEPLPIASQAAIDPSLAPDLLAEAAPLQNAPQAAIDPSLAPDPLAEAAPLSAPAEEAPEVVPAPAPLAESEPPQADPPSVDA